MELRDKMPKRPRSHQIEDLSRNRLRQAFEQWGWIVEDLAKDYGEDLFVRIFDREFATPYTFFIQAKSTDHIGSHIGRDPNTMRVRVETGHLRHWTRFSEPVLLTLWDSSQDLTYWVCVQDEADQMRITDSHYKKKSLSIKIPRSNQINEDGILRIRGITKLRYERHLREKTGAQILLDLIEERAGVKVHDYDSDMGFLSLENPHGVPEWILFGEMQDIFQKLSEKARLGPMDLLRKGMKMRLEQTRHMTRAQARKEAKQEILEMNAERERNAGSS